MSEGNPMPVHCQAILILRLVLYLNDCLTKQSSWYSFEILFSYLLFSSSERKLNVNGKIQKKSEIFKNSDRIIFNSLRNCCVSRVFCYCKGNINDLDVKSKVLPADLIEFIIFSFSLFILKYICLILF